MQSFSSSAQFVESFDDGDFSQNPGWSGDTDVFIVNTNSALQLNDVDVSKSEAYLSVNAATGAMATWRFTIQLDFSPSGTNFARVYLNANQPNLTSSLDGYFVKIGGISGNDDAVELIQQNGTSETVLISGTPGGVGTSTVNVSVEVVLDANGNWNLNVDYNDGAGLINEGTSPAVGTVSGGFFGIVCNYTSTRSEAFSLDDIFIDPIIVDETGPSLLSAVAIDASNVLLTFDEEIDLSNLDASSFTLDNGVNIDGVSSISNNELQLSVSPDLTSNTTYMISANNIADAVGNLTATSSTSFTYIQTFAAAEFDILINEFMADPTPQVGLPDAEYVELFNNTNQAFQLNDYMIASGGTPVLLPEFLFEPSTYLILTDEDNASLFQAFGIVVGVDGMPTLTNTTDEILIQNTDGSTIHRIVYNQDWYQDTDKEEGGFSIELINPAQACKAQSNYRASDNISGGTPGVVNSVLNDEVDAEAPSLDALFTVDNATLLLSFSEPLTAFSAEEPLNYLLSDNLSVASAQVQSNPNQVELILAEELIEGQIYSLQYENIADCLGNASMRSDSAFFALAQTPEVGDIIINEVLFNPVSGGVDYVELYNLSDRVINLSDLTLENLNPEVLQSESILIDYLMFPGTYACITPDKSDILSAFPVDDPSTIFENDLPRLDDDFGNISVTTVTDGQLTIIDSFDYEDDLHSNFLADDNGVALERISFESPTNNASNWTSGVQATGFGTPGYQNAQVIDNPTVSSTDFFEIINPTFSPDGDGFKDFMQVQFTLDQANYLGSMRIYDDQGRLIHQLLPNQILSPNIIVNWDGVNDDGAISRMGIHILWIELLSPDGTREVFKEPIVVARNFN